MTLLDFLHGIYLFMSGALCQPALEEYGLFWGLVYTVTWPAATVLMWLWKYLCRFNDFVKYKSNVWDAFCFWVQFIALHRWNRLSKKVCDRLFEMFVAGTAVDHPSYIVRVRRRHVIKVCALNEASDFKQTTEGDKPKYLLVALGLLLLSVLLVYLSIRKY